MYPAVFVFAKPPQKGEVGSVAARRGEPLCHCVTLPLSGEVTPLSLRDISPFRGDKSEHSVTVLFFRGDSVP